MGPKLHCCNLGLVPDTHACFVCVSPLRLFCLRATDRDLKPANVLVLSDCQLRITDFGLARLARRPSEDEIEEGSESSLNLTGCEDYGEGRQCRRVGLRRKAAGNAERYHKLRFCWRTTEYVVKPGATDTGYPFDMYARMTGTGRNLRWSKLRTRVEIDAFDLIVFGPSIKTSGVPNYRNSSLVYQLVTSWLVLGFTYL